MRRRTRLVLSAACGLLAMLLAATYANAAQREAEAARAEALARYGGEVTSLVVARKGLAAGDVVAQTDVEVREWLVDLAPAGALSSLDDVVGLRLTSAVASGAPLSSVDFSGADGVLEVPEGRVAISVRLTDKTGVSGQLASGARLLAYEVTSSGTSLISADVTVIGAGGAGSNAVSNSSLTLAVSPGVVTQVLAAGAEGTLRLAVPAADVEADASQAAAPSSVEAEDVPDAALHGAPETTSAPEPSPDDYEDETDTAAPTTASSSSTTASAEDGDAR